MQIEAIGEMLEEGTPKRKWYYFDPVIPEHAYASPNAWIAEDGTQCAIFGGYPRSK